MMRTTVTLDADVVALVERAQQEQRIGVDEAVNRLIRAGAAGLEQSRYEHRSAPLGLIVDITDIGAVLERLDEA